MLLSENMLNPNQTSAAAGKRFHQLRLASRVSVERLASRAGMSTSELLAFEAGRSRPSIATLDKLARQLGTSLVDLLRPSNEAEPPPPPATKLRGLEQIADAILALPASVGDKLAAVDAAAIKLAMTTCRGNKSATARLLGVDRQAAARLWTKTARRRS
jgi:transcriptional regulator with XRE-family HTH domain